VAGSPAARGGGADERPRREKDLTGGKHERGATTASWQVGGRNEKGSRSHGEDEAIERQSTNEASHFASSVYHGVASRAAGDRLRRHGPKRWRRPKGGPAASGGWGEKAGTARRCRGSAGQRRRRWRRWVVGGGGARAGRLGRARGQRSQHGGGPEQDEDGGWWQSGSGA
uniref:Uncharacterized protein n=1 Tax=Oryza glumipatula TaxID=40148 RepID=A0A0E0BRE0_9ORYZ